LRGGGGGGTIEGSVGNTGLCKAGFVYA
jgi:hypothetical protein